MFIDEAVIEIVAGNGGNGCIAFRREKFVPRGGPSGGDGGQGGSVWFVGQRRLGTLHHLRYRRRIAAERGRHGEGSNCTGRSGEDVEIAVPLGTVVLDRDTGAQLGEIIEEGARLLVASGGRGGKGNARFKTATRQAPRYAEDGGEGEERFVRLELKLLADVGLVGLPNAGKSTLISAVSAARPRIADYPFTTLVPNLGVVGGEVPDNPFVIADLPGLIAGAAAGAGLGHRFLRHVERCRILVHLVDLGPIDPVEGDPESQLDTIEHELEAFDPSLMTRTRIIVGSKADVGQEERREALKLAAEQRSLPYFELSAVARQGLDPFIGWLREQLDAIAAAEEDEEKTDE